MIKSTNKIFQSVGVAIMILVHTHKNISMTEFCEIIIKYEK